MPQRLDLGRGGFSPVEVAKAYRDEHPHQFDDATDGELMKAMETDDPEVFRLVDPLLIGSEILPHYAKGAPPPPGPLPTPPVPQSFLDTAITTGLRTVPAVGGALVGGYFGGPAGGYAGGAGGAGLGEAAAQYYETHFGNRQDYSPGVMAFEAGLGALNPATRGSTFLARTAYQTAFGGALGAGGATGRSLIEQGQLPSAGEVGTSAVLGGAFGGATHLGFEAYRAAREAQLGQKLLDLYKGRTRTSGQPTPSDLHTAQQAKSYLEELAALNAPPVPIPPIQPGLTETPYAAGPPQPQLPRGRGDPGAFRAYPPGENPQIELVGQGAPPANRIIGGQDVGAGSGPPPTLQDIVAQTTAGTAEVGPPRLVSRPLELTPSEASVPRGIAETPPLLDRPTRIQGGRIEQGGRMGGRPATAEQPRIPGTAEPTPLDRTYATGPNAGPRRQGEAHGQPRLVRRRLQVGKTFRFEQVPSSRPAEDPGTYQPEVRRELARMLHELQTYRYERVAGGTTQGQLQAMAESTGLHGGEVVGATRARGASAGGAIPGAPVYHDIIREAGGARAHATREEIIQELRAALLEGKGTAISDAAAEVARQRIAQEGRGGLTPEGYKAGSFTSAKGTRREGYPIISSPGAGDAIIGWVDEAGRQALPEQDLGIFEREVRDETDGGLLAALRLEQEGDINPEVQGYFDAARNEAVRRGLIRPAQPGLTMEGPGGERGPTLFDFEGGEVPPEPGVGGVPPELPEAGGGPIKWGPEGPSGRAAKDLAAGRDMRQLVGAPPPGITERRHTELMRRFAGGTEEARREAYPTAEELGAAPEPQGPPPLVPRSPNLREPFGPDVQPELPGAEGVRTQEIPTPAVADLPFALSPPPARPGRTSAEMPSLLDRLFEEEGVLILNVPSGDRQGLRKWLAKQEEEHGGSSWFARVEQHMEDGEWDKAWKTAAAASVRSYSKAFSEAKTPQQEALLARAVRGTPLQEDINAQIIARGRRESGLGTAPTVSEFPPSQRISQAGAARGKATIGPAGIINPGPIRTPLKPSERAHTLPRTFVETVINETDPELVHIVPGNEDSMLRLYRQVGDLAFAGTNTRELKQYLGLSDQEIGQHFIEAVQEAARTLQSLSAFRQANDSTLTAAAEQMSMGGALRGMLGEGRVIVGKRGQVIGTTGPTIDAQATLDTLAETTGSFDQAMLANTLQRPKKASELELLQAASYPFMLMRWRTAVRNAMSAAGRYTVDALDDALTIPLATLLGDTEGAALAKGLTREKLKLRGKAGGLVTPRTAWKETLQDIYDFTSSSLAQLDPADARRTLALLEKVPDTQAHFMGAMAGGEQFAEGGSRFRLLNAILDPKLQRILTVFNRAQEFSGRGVVFDATMRGQLRARGLNADEVLQLPYDDLVSTVGGEASMQNLLHNATAAALEATFSGVAAKQSIPGALLHAVNTMWPLKLGYPFPKFNIVAAPRWIYDHSPAALMELIRFPLDTVGLTSGEFAGGRLYRGVRGQKIQQTALPELAGKRQDAIGRLGAAQRELLSTTRELGVRTRQVARLERRAQAGLPDVSTALDEARTMRDHLTARRDTVRESVTLERDRIRKLKAQEDKLLDVVRDAQGINAPTIPQYIARMTTGTALLGAAAVIRAQKDAEGTRWYEYRYDKGDGSDPDILDFRPYAPFAQYLMVADALQDITRFTDWSAAHAQAPQDGWTKATWNNYEGKYTSDEMKAQLAQAFLSISRVGGTTLTLTDLMTQNGWPGPQEAGDAIVGTLGQFLSRFYTGFGDVKDVAAGFSAEEAKVRIPPRATAEEWTRPLAAPLSQVPGVSRVIPERISQTTGKAVTTTHPWLRALAGIGSAPRDFITEEVRRVGVPGQSVFIRETGDYGLDRMVAETYAQILQQELPAILEDPQYVELGTPARQRDFLQRYVFPPLKRAALGETRSLLGESRFTEATVQGEEARRRQRQQKLLEDLEGETPVEAPQPEDLVGTAPPGPPGPSAAGAPPPPPF